MKKKIFIIAALLGIFIIWWIITLYPDWLWFEELGYSSVFWTMLYGKFGTGAVVWIIFCFIVFLNLYIASRFISREKLKPVQSAETYLSQLGISGATANLFLMGIIVFIGFLISMNGSSQWDMILKYFNQRPFGVSDPIFHRDVAFYVFSLPFCIFMQSQLKIFFILTLLASVVWYFKNGALQVTNVAELVQPDGKPSGLPKVSVIPGAKKHLAFLGGLVALILGWGYYLKMFTVLYSTNGAAFGAGYTDVVVMIPVYKVLVILSVLFAFFLFWCTFRGRFKAVVFGGGIWVASIFLLSTAIPVIVQKFVVKPNELTKESVYIENNIRFTNLAYKLDTIKEVNFPVSDRLTMQDITADKSTIQNIRIWDKRPLLQTYRQIQAIRLYYDFNDVDVDRYIIDKNYRQIMLSAREFVENKLPAQANTWVNRHLIYTHGYGLAASPVNEVTTEGLPDLLIKDLPPVINMDITIDHPEIYYGEKTQDYVFVNTRTKEFDYPKGDKNVYTHYQGKGGVNIGTFARRLLFSIQFLDPQILFTNYLSPKSRIMYYRRIDRRVRAIAPFLAYDSDPYLVISEGRLYWVQDAYTTSNMYPYSIRTIAVSNTQLNYIRNSVKITIDAYNGDVCFYVIDKEDPVIKSYIAIFPELFKPIEQMPSNLKKHIRYPKDLFKVQADIYRTYHMKDPQVFYNQEDLWQIPDEIYGNSPQKMEPYYIILRLPKEPKGEFVLMIPFTPSSKQNMIAWMAARCDLHNYGTLIVYKLPKEKLVFGPMQIEARVDQQTNISKELTLWGQRGSTVIRGNLLVIPIRETFIYVEPIYLVAKQSETEPPMQEPTQQRRTLMRRQKTQVTTVSQAGLSRNNAALPELKRVIVAFGNHLIMSKNLDSALRSLLGKGEFTPLRQRPSSAGGPSPSMTDMARQALEHYNKAMEHLRAGNWAGYGKEQKIVQQILHKIAEQKQKSK